eukprot:maker-scaffold_6-snap-gene-19.44-mRNA-1 protein AED:0.05 eAED:0.05 QI:138/1/0.87/1/0.85/0.75/8/119/720
MGNESSTQNRGATAATTRQETQPARRRAAPVRCPTCRKMLIPPPGHTRFRCVCGQVLMIPSAQPVRIACSFNFQIHIKCPRCQNTLAPPEGATVFRCPCGAALRAPVQRQSSARALNIPTQPTGQGSTNNYTGQKGAGKFINDDLLPEEAIASQLQKPNDEHWIRNTDENNQLYWVRLTSEQQEAKIQELQKNCKHDMEERINDLSIDELTMKVKALGLDPNEAFDHEELKSKLMSAHEVLDKLGVEEIKKLLDSHSTDYASCVDKADMVSRLIAVAWYGESYFSDGFVSQLESENGNFNIKVVPAQKYKFDVEFKKYGITPAEVEKMSGKPFKEKLEWFRGQCKKAQIRWEDGRVQIKIRREELLRDSFNNFNRLKGNDLRRYLRFEFIGEEGVDAGGVAREWFEMVTDSCFNVDCGLFEYSGVDNLCYQINPASGIANELHTDYFFFLGRVVGKALFDHKFIRAHVTQPLYKHILGWPITMKDIEYSDYGLYKSLEDMEEASAEEIEDYYLTFSTVLDVFGEQQEIMLKENGGELDVTGRNVHEYIQLMTKYHMFERTKRQLAHFLAGLYDVIPPVWLSIFDFRELELLLCGLPNISVDDWKKNTKYRGAYTKLGANHKVVKWFWEVVEAASQEQRAMLLQYCTGTSRVPVQGFEALQGNDGNIKPFTIDSAKLSNVMYPKAHTCFNRIELPLYRTKSDLVKRLEEALSQGTTGFSDE